MARGKCGSNLKSMILKRIIENSNLATRSEIVVKQMPQNITNKKSWLV